jgi:hypothetical protein
MLSQLILRATPTWPGGVRLGSRLSTRSNRVQKASPPPHNAGTPAGTYTVDVTATAPTAPNLSHTIQLALTVN